MTSDYAYKKVEKFGPKNKTRRVWADEIVDGFRCIYLRCAACNQVFELGNATGTVRYNLSIGLDGDVTPCIICPYCDNHLFVRLDGYKKIEVPDFFSPDQ